MTPPSEAHALEIHLRDLGASLVDAWAREFANVPSVTTSCGDIFSTKSGTIEPTIQST